MHCTVTEWPEGALTFELTDAPGWRVDYVVGYNVRIVPDPPPAECDSNAYRWLYRDMGDVTWVINRSGVLQLELFDEAAP